MTDELGPGEDHMVRVGGHLIYIANRDGEPQINIRDHADIVVEGEHKDNPTVHVVNEEWPTVFRRHSEGWVWERYNGES